MKCVFLINGSRGLYILKHLKNFKLIGINAVIFCQKINKKKINLLNLKISKKKITYIKNINSKKSELFFKKINPDLIIIAGYPQILKKKIFNISKLMTINLHGGPLPQYRGGSPLNWQIINGEKKIGLSILRVDEGIDTGKVLIQSKFELLKKYTIKDVHKKANIFFLKMLKKIIKDLKSGNLKQKIQMKKKAKYWRQRSDKDGYLDFKKITGKEADSFIRALTKPYPGAWCYIKSYKNKKKIRIFSGKIVKKNLVQKPGSYRFVNRKLYMKSSDKTFLINSYKYF